jgi:hypothetical protein
MKRAAAILGIVFLAGTAGAEDRSGGPLEGTKQELKSLQADQAAAKNGVAAGKLSDGLPQLQAPVPGAVPLELTAPDKLEQDLKKRKAAQKNWLLDGVGRLERESRAKARGKNDAGDSSSDADEQAGDRSDPDYLLKLYSEQTRGKANQNQAGALRGGASSSDPMAPFLQNWLADSPVRGKFFDDFVKKSDSGDSQGTVAGGLSGNGTASAGFSGELPGMTRVFVATKPAANPYLQAPAMPALQERSSATGSASTPSWTPALPAPRDPILPVRPDDKKPQELAPLDNQKYFPQQKKF